MYGLSNRILILIEDYQACVFLEIDGYTYLEELSLSLNLIK
jgi:hypothetical protein